MGLDLDVTEIERALREFSIRSEYAITTLCESGALKFENYAKTNRPWTDRTSQARQRLKGSVERPADYTWEVLISHGVDYGIYLEFAHERKYAIIQPTIQMQGPEVMESFEGLITRLWNSL